MNVCVVCGRRYYDFVCDCGYCREGDEEVLLIGLIDWEVVRKEKDLFLAGVLSDDVC